MTNHDERGLEPGSAEPAEESLDRLLGIEAHHLRDEFGTPEEAARRELHAIADGYLKTAHVRRFVPILAHRRAKERLVSVRARRAADRSRTGQPK